MNLTKWNTFRDKKDQVVRQYVMARNRQECVKEQISFIIIYGYLIKVYRKFAKRLKEVQQWNRMQWYLRVSIRLNQKKQKALGETITIRDRRLVKNAITLMGRWSIRLVERKAYSRYLLPFLREAAYREFIKYKFVRTMELVVFIQQRFKNSIEIMNAKLIALKTLWEKEKQQIQFSICGN